LPEYVEQPAEIIAVRLAARDQLASAENQRAADQEEQIWRLARTRYESESSQS